MNRRNFILSFLFFLTIVSGVNSTPIIGEFEWNDLEICIDRKVKVDEIKKLDHSIINHLKSFPFNYLNDDEALGWFHFIEITGDGNIDIIYYGPSSSESFVTIIFINIGAGGYRELFSFMGRPMNIWKPTPSLPASLKMLEAGCCDDPVQSIQTYFPRFDEGYLSYELVDKINFSKSLTIPKNFEMSKNFYIKNEYYKLRDSPEIPEESESNVVATYQLGAKGIALAHKLDTTGRIWWFVLMKKESPPKVSILHEGINNTDEYHIYGWMSSRYLEEE